jgi:hypothetical protein
MNNLSITIEVKSIYGKEQIYPVDSLARGFCDLLGQKTLTRADISKIKELGYEIQIKQNVITL